MRLLTLLLAGIISVPLFAMTPAAASAGGIYIGSGSIEIGDLRIGIGSAHRYGHYGKVVHHYPYRGYKKVIRYGPYGKRHIHNKFYGHGYNKPYYRKQHRPHKYYKRGYKKYNRPHRYYKRGFKHHYRPHKFYRQHDRRGYRYR